MKQISSAASDAAARVWAANVDASHQSAVLVDSVDKLLQAQRATLGRWIGVAGYDILLQRAVGITREDFAWIGPVFHTRMDPADLLAAVESFGTPVVAAGCKMLIAVLIELLGRIVGTDMAIHLMEQIGTSDARSAIRSASEGKLDD
ncbi:MAG: hypothetical protein ABI852_15095 [Gemmatimonadaceae bacterium]